MLQPSGLLTTHVTTISSRLGVLAHKRARQPPQSQHASASMLLQSDQVARQRREMRGNKVYGGAETWRAAEYMCRCWPGHRKFGELHVGQVDRTTHHQQSRGQLTRASRGELQRAQRLAGVESGGVYVSLLARTSEVW